MRVHELINALKQMPRNAKVILNTHSDYQYIDCDNVTLSGDHSEVEISSDDPHAEDE